MAKQVAARDVVLLEYPVKQDPKRPKLSCGKLILPVETDPDVAFVGPLDVRALHTFGAAGLGVAGRVNDPVVTAIQKTSSKVPSAYLIHGHELAVGA